MKTKKAKQIIDRGGQFTEVAKTKLEGRLARFKLRVSDLERLIQENEKRKRAKGSELGGI